MHMADRYAGGTGEFCRTLRVTLGAHSALTLGRLPEPQLTGCCERFCLCPVGRSRSGITEQLTFP